LYTGKASVLGNDATIAVNVKSSSSLDFLVTITGLVSIKIDCKGEAYVLNGNTITLSGLGDKHNCIQHGLNS